MHSLHNVAKSLCYKQTFWNGLFARCHVVNKSARIKRKVRRWWDIPDIPDSSCYGFYVLRLIFLSPFFWNSCGKWKNLKGLLRTRNAFIFSLKIFVSLVFFYNFQQVTHWPITWTVIFFCCLFAISTFIVLEVKILLYFYILLL
jgi:hypothetical protein